MEQNKEDIFKRFLAKAEKRAEEKKIHRTCLVRVPSMDERIRIRGLSKQEIAEVSEIDNTGDPYAGDKYSVYIATVDPDLKAIAKQMKEDGNIQEYTDVVDIFEIYETRQLAEKIMELSGVSGKNKIEVIEESLKN